MTVLLDTNVLVAAVTHDTERSETAIDVLNDATDPVVSILSLVELRSVLAKKKRIERDRIDRIETRITARATITVPDAGDIMAANRLQSETLLYPMDAFILTAADTIGATLLTFDREHLEHGGRPPRTVAG